MLISFVVPVYNVEKYLRRCLDSIISNRGKDFEIVLVDDGSTDGSGDICDEYCEKYDQIVVVHKKNGGLSDARNAGIAKSAGDYLCFVDSDDFIDSDYVEKIGPFLNGGNDIVILDARSNIDEDYAVHSSLRSGVDYSGLQCFSEMAEQNNCIMASWLYTLKKSFLLENHLFFKTGILHEDENFTPKCLMKAARVHYTALKLYNYMVRPDSITTKRDKRKNILDFTKTCLELNSLYEKECDAKTRRLLTDVLASKYIGLVLSSDILYRKDYKKYVDFKFIFNAANKKKTRIKAIGLLLFPRMMMHYYKRKQNDGVKEKWRS